MLYVTTCRPWIQVNVAGAPRVMWKNGSVIQTRSHICSLRNWNPLITSSGALDSRLRLILPSKRAWG